jgi:hypothetical protein
MKTVERKTVEMKTVERKKANSYIGYATSSIKLDIS